jgi:ketosteroid isomerase-like protein
MPITSLNARPGAAQSTGALMARNGITDADIADLVRRCQYAAAALIRGDVRSYLDLFVHADDYTLIPPFGGTPRHGFDSSQEAVEQLSAFFGGGEVQVDVVQSYASGDFVVLVLIERQHGTVGGLPEQDWSLRVTMLFRREGEGWRLVHRHADPLVREIDLHRAAALARGDGPAADA